MPRALELVVAVSWEDDWLALVSLAVAIAVALVSIPLSILAHRRAGAADRRDKERHELALAEAAAARRAELALEPRPTAGVSDGTAEPRALVRNLGPATARNVTAWLVDDHHRQRSTVSTPIVTLAKGDEPLEIRVLVHPEKWPETDLHQLRWRIAWTDDDDSHELTTGWRPPGSEPIDLF